MLSDLGKYLLIDINKHITKNKDNMKQERKKNHLNIMKN